MSGLKLRALLEEQYFPAALGIRNAKTKAHYRRAVSRFAEFLRREPAVEDLDEDHLRAHLHWLETDIGQGPETVNHHRKNLLALARWCVTEHLLDRVPRIAKLLVPEEPPEAWTEEELTRLIHAGTSAPGTIGGAPLSDWWRTAFALELQTAARYEELSLIEWQHMRPDGRIIVPSTIRKRRVAGAAYRLLPWSLAIINDFARYCPTPDKPSGPVLLGVDKATVYRHFSALLIRAGLPADRKCKWHKLRRTVATVVTLGGGNPTLALRNSSDSVTWKHYVDQSQVAEPIGKYLPATSVNALVLDARPCTSSYDSTRCLSTIRRTPRAERRTPPCWPWLSA